MSAILELLLRKHEKCRHFLAEEILQVGGRDWHLASLASDICSMSRGTSAMTKKGDTEGFLREGRCSQVQHNEIRTGS